jgi:hypothetical protein
MQARLVLRREALNRSTKLLAVALVALGAAIAPAAIAQRGPPGGQAAAAPSDPAANAAAKAATLKPIVKPGYVVPRGKDGKPDLSGNWTNASATNLTRTPSLGNKLEYTREEMATLEKETFERNARQNAKTPKELQDNWNKIALAGPDTLDECRSGSRGPACGYNAGWTDPGDWVMRVNGMGRTSLVTYPVSGRMPGRVPNSSAGRTQIVTSSEEDAGRGAGEGPESRSLGERCIMSFGVSSGPVMTDQLYNNTYQMVQTKDHFVILVEMVHDARIIPIGAKHRTDGIRPWMGDQIGWWEGDTFVVETIGFHPRQNVRGGGPKMKVTERFTRVAEDRLHYAFDVVDPETWVEPWGGEYEFAKSKENVYEYACHEGNYGLEGILSGARADDAKAAAKAAAAKPAATPTRNRN